jgi:ubiquinone/menaquinone biosynthesis C-methylase UbiE
MDHNCCKSRLGPCGSKEAADNRLFREWDAYEKVVRNDYMHHRDFFAALACEVENRLDGPLWLVDLGCGDCGPVMPLFERFDIGGYVGIDESETASARARSRLAKMPCPSELRCGSMIEELHRVQGRHNLVLASYSLHHLSREQKQEVLEQSRRLLRRDGILAVVDIFLEDKESPERYMERWVDHARRNFSALSAEEMQALLAHVYCHDIPETVSVYRRLGRAAGFERFTTLLQDRRRLNRLVVLY